ncbi:hypothetical protein BDF22DRAFT_667089 [Syncephalis plumigaleata]|nr:hypothetical protein BDF22DRAFT_667089 [Syncephalis plumigaleata]
MRFYSLLSLLVGVSVVSGAVISSNCNDKTDAKCAVTASSSSTKSTKLERRDRPHAHSDVLLTRENDITLVMPLKPNATNFDGVKNITEVVNIHANGTDFVAVTNSTDPSARQKITDWIAKHVSGKKLKNYIAEHAPLAGAVGLGSIASLKLSAFLGSAAVGMPAMFAIGVATDILNHTGTSVIDKLRKKYRKNKKGHSHEKDEHGHGHTHGDDDDEHDGHSHDDDASKAGLSTAALAQTAGCCPGCACTSIMLAGRRGSTPSTPTLSRQNSMDFSAASASASAAAHDHAHHHHGHGHDHAHHHHH